MIDVAATGDAALRARLQSHPRVARVEDNGLPGIRFRQGPWDRHLASGSLGIPLGGLVELMDNNPLVCADEATVPDPVGTLACVGIGPVAQAGLLLEPPVVMASYEADPIMVDRFLEHSGWGEGVTLAVDPVDLGGVVAVNCMLRVRNPGDFEELDELFEERYGRSLYVRRSEEGDWDAAQVQGRPFALYRLRLSPGEEDSLLTVQVMADRDGKCGSAQMVHAMNVMAGFEESLGVA